MLEFVEFLSSSDDEEEHELDECDWTRTNQSKGETAINEAIEEHTDSDDNIETPQSKTKAVSTKSKPANTQANREQQQKKKETIALIKQLATHIITMEKEKKSQLYAKKKKSDEQPFKSLEEMENKYNSQRKIERETLKENLSKTGIKLERFKRDKLPAQKSPANLEKLKILMEEIEADIMQMKEKQKLIYEDLMMEEKSLSIEIESCNKKFDNWSNKTLPIPQSAIKKKNEEGKDERLPEEVILFEKFVQVTNGHQGGWDDIDHQLFVKLQKQYKKPSQFMEKALESIPTHTENEIKQHVEWYQQYTVLNEKKREAIRKWKKNKTNRKDDMLSNSDTTLGEREEMEKKKKRDEMFERERQERILQLQKWKAMKTEEEEMKRNNEEILKDERENLKIQKLMEEKRRLETKIQIQEYKLKRREEEDIMQQIREDEERQKRKQVSTLEKERIRERNERIMDQKKTKQLSAQVAEEEKEERLRKLKGRINIHVERDPNRLLKPTEGWKRRQNDTENNRTKADHMIGTRGLPHRAVPSWRQGIP